ncbi:MAG: type II toxin-antitoxin system YafQ family toxin [Rectinemataceae bacterium]|nr:type II toxin-antitoxin system YafQ family toxin [Rectinemataceae bacterium]
MLTVIPTGRFRKDYALMQRRGKDMDKLVAIVDRIAALEPLEQRHKDHALCGEWEGCRDCHVEPDWLLIYWADAHSLHLVRTGTHADLFR